MSSKILSLDAANEPLTESWPRVLSVEEKEEGWNLLLMFREKVSKNEPILKYVLFPRVPISTTKQVTSHAPMRIREIPTYIIEGSKKTFGGIKIDGFLKYFPKLIDDSNFVTRIGFNSPRRARFLDTATEKINHHIKQDSDFLGSKFHYEPSERIGIKYVVSETYILIGKTRIKVISCEEQEDNFKLIGEQPTKEIQEYIFPKNQEFTSVEKRLNEKEIPMEYIFKAGKWIPELFLKFEEIKAKRAKRQDLISLTIKINTELVQAKTVEEKLAVFEKYKVEIPEESKDTRMRWLKKGMKIESGEIYETVPFQKANGGVSNYSFTPHGSVDAGSRSWSDILAYRIKRGTISPELAQEAERLILNNNQRKGI